MITYGDLMAIFDNVGIDEDDETPIQVNLNGTIVDVNSVTIEDGIMHINA